MYSDKSNTQNLTYFKVICDSLPSICNWNDHSYEDSLISNSSRWAEDYCIWKLKELANGYWLWMLQACKLNQLSAFLNRSNTQYLNSENSTNNTIDYMHLSNPHRGPFPHIKENLISILKVLNDGNEISFRRSLKSARGLYFGVSRRRSRYIGVLKNGRRWQTLVNEGRTKKYIGTYSTEVEAAVVYDFYSIGLNGFSAKTNFNYSSSQVRTMILSYLSNNLEFNPSIFISQIN